MARETRLKKALRESSPLRELVQDGMGAFLSADIKLVAENQRDQIGDSLDLDAASQSEDPQANRWDYIVSVPDLKIFVGIEPHTAKDSEVSVVIAKKKHASAYLRNHFKNGHT